MQRKAMQTRFEYFFLALHYVCSLPLRLHTAPAPSINKVSQTLCRQKKSTNHCTPAREAHCCECNLMTSDTVYLHAPRCSCKGLNFQLRIARNLYSVKRCEVCFHCFKATCSVHKHTIQQVPDFIHVDLKVGDLQQNKKTWEISSLL